VTISLWRFPRLPPSFPLPPSPFSNFSFSSLVSSFRTYVGKRRTSPFLSFPTPSSFLAPGKWNSLWRSSFLFFFPCPFLLPHYCSEDQRGNFFSPFSFRPPPFLSFHTTSIINLGIMAFFPPFPPHSPPPPFFHRQKTECCNFNQCADNPPPPPPQIFPHRWYPTESEIWLEKGRISHFLSPPFPLFFYEPPFLPPLSMSGRKGVK